MKRSELKQKLEERINKIPCNHCDYEYEVSCRQNSNGLMDVIIYSINSNTKFSLLQKLSMFLNTTIIDVEAYDCSTDENYGCYADIGISIICKKVNIDELIERLENEDE